MKNKAQGYRGYIGSRLYSCGDFPQYVQNLLLRNYCQKHQLPYLLSATEYMMPGCYMMLEEVLGTLDVIDGIVLFSIFMLPESPIKRARIYKKILSSECTLHGALEDLSIRNWGDVQIVEDILNLNRIALTEECLVDLDDFCLNQG